MLSPFGTTEQAPQADLHGAAVARSGTWTWLSGLGCTKELG